MNVGSLFSGIGGLELALESFGHTTVWQVESDQYARGVLAHHWPDVERFDDVRAVGAANLRVVDIICGGFPCQDISTAGRRAGITGSQSGLWAEYARIVRELRPRYVFVENVAALVIRGLGRVLGDLADLGYDAEWDCLRAADVGAPHLRNRIFILAYAHSGRPHAESAARSGGDSLDARGYGSPSAMADPEGHTRRLPDKAWAGNPQSVGRGETLAHAVGAGLSGAEREVICGAGWRDEGRAAAECGWWDTEPHVGRVASGVPARVDRLRCLGNAVVPAQAALAWRTLMARIA